MIRKAELSDAGAIAGIYNRYIANSTATFETEPLTEEEMRERIASVYGHFPYFVYETQENRIAGYCYAHRWKEKAAYGRTLEATVYLAQEYTGKGIGRMLMEKLIRECRKDGYHALIACITEDNDASCALYSKLGFRQVSHFPEVGLKFGRLLGVKDYELLLGPAEQ